MPNHRTDTITLPHEKPAGHDTHDRESLWRHGLLLMRNEKVHVTELQQSSSPLRGGRSTTKTGKECMKWFQVVSSGHWRVSLWLLSSFWNDHYSLYWKGKPHFHLLKRLATVSCFRDEPFKFTQSFRKLNIPDPRSVQALGEECPH